MAWRVVHGTGICSLAFRLEKGPLCSAKGKTANRDKGFCTLNEGEYSGWHTNYTLERCRTNLIQSKPGGSCLDSWMCRSDRT